MLVSDLDELLQRVVASEMIADVPLGAFLSGGVDSSLIVALMQAQSTQRVRTFTIGFREDGFDEAAHARRIAAHLGSDHTELYVSPRDALDVIPELAAMYDEPFADSSQIPTTLVSRLTRQHVTVAVSGDGGDEVFGGYNRYAAIPRLMRQRERMGRSVARMTARLASIPSIRAWNRLLKVTGVTSSQGLRGLHVHKVARILEKESLREMYYSAATTCDDATFLFEQNRDASQVHQGATVPWSGDPVTAMMVADGLTYLPDDILVKVDRASMAASLEVRAPYLHCDVLTFAAGIPARNRATASGQGKALLRQVLSRYVPPALTERPKSGFAVPIAEWLNGPLRPWVDDLTASSAVQRLGLSRDRVLRLVTRHRRGRSEVAPLLWGVLMAIAWAEGCGEAYVQPVPAGRG
jgi:asparagine synthase (glutamine-hydrolysing)